MFSMICVLYFKAYTSDKAKLMFPKAPMEEDGSLTVSTKPQNSHNCATAAAGDSNDNQYDNREEISREGRRRKGRI